MEGAIDGGLGEDAHVLGNVWLAGVFMLRCSLGCWRSETPFSWNCYQNRLCFSSKWMAQKSKYQKWIAPHNGIPSEQGHVTMGHFQLPVLSLSIPVDVTSFSFNNGAPSTISTVFLPNTCLKVAFIFVVIFKDDILACRSPLLSPRDYFLSVV